MIFLSKKNLLFIKTKKTAGTSVELALSLNASEDDIITPVSLSDEFKRLDLKGQFPVNWGSDKAAEENYFNTIMQLYKHRHETPAPRFKLEKYKASCKYFNHFTPDQIVPTFGKNNFENAHKVTICRHPYEQLVSHAFYLVSINKLSLNETIENLLSKKTGANLPFYFLGGRLSIDTFVRYEYLLSDLKELEKKFSLQLLNNLPVCKGDFRLDRRPAHEILNKSQKRRCLELNRWEFEYFDYKAFL